MKRYLTEKHEQSDAYFDLRDERREKIVYWERLYDDMLATYAACPMQFQTTRELWEVFTPFTHGAAECSNANPRSEP